MLFYGFATYGNAGFMREQVCKYMCPYARFQSAMFDQDTLIVSYDAARGEPRGRALARQDPRARPGRLHRLQLCVQVCPTGIDIRKGLQYECIGCAACIDACDGVMDKMGYPRGLIRFTTQNAHGRGWPRADAARVLRPRVLVYGAILLALTAALMMASLALRTPLKVDVVRDRGALRAHRRRRQARERLPAAGDERHRGPQSYRITADGLPGLALASEREVDVGPAESRWVPVRLQIAYGTVAARLASHPFRHRDHRRRRPRPREVRVPRSPPARRTPMKPDTQAPDGAPGGSTATCGCSPGPAAVVLAGIATAVIAVRGSDPVVEADYYRRGIEINKTLAARRQVPAARDAGRNHAATPARQ